MRKPRTKTRADRTPPQAAFATVEEYRDRRSVSELGHESLQAAALGAEFRCQQRREAARQAEFAEPGRMMQLEMPDQDQMRDWGLRNRFEEVYGYGPGKATIRPGDALVPKRRGGHAR